MTSAIEKTLEHVKFIARHLNHCDYSTVVILALMELGIAPKNDGYVFLKKAVAMYYEDPMRHLKDDIYAKISVELDGTEDSDRIEQAIRRAIAEAWKARDDEVWSMLFPRAEDGSIEKPSNRDFISRVAWFVELWQGCCKEVAYARQ